LIIFQQFINQNSPFYWDYINVDIDVQKAGKILSFQSYGTPDTARQIDDRTVEFVANQPIQTRKKLEVLVTFPSNIMNFSKPNFEVNIYYWVKNVFLIFMSFYVLSFLWGLRFNLPFFYRKIPPNKLSHCPQCNTYSIKIIYLTLVEATYKRVGKQRVIEYCKNCSYQKNYKQVIPVRIYTVGSGYSNWSRDSWSGGDGGGGGGGGGDGGGDGGGGGGGGG
jgi:uncharacterized membrane protein YgcG